jgi:tetratricopeptide (TPR) repeat protein
MINRNFYIISVVFILLSFGPFASGDESSDPMLRGIDCFNSAYNHWDEKEFLSSLDMFKRASRAGQNDGLAEYWSGAVYFFLAQYNLFTYEKPTNKKQGIENVKKGIEVLTRSIELAPDFSESYALRGVLRGILIKMKPSSVFTQGRKVGKDRKRALALNMSNPRVHYLTGVSFWHAPEILGGRDKALKHLLEAEKLFEMEKKKAKGKLIPSWGQSTCLAFIGDIYSEQKKISNAREYYSKALEINPKDPLAKRGLKKLESLK